MKSQFSQTALTKQAQDFMQVDHLVLRGSNFEMGRQLAEIAIHKHPGDPAKIGAQRRYMQKTSHCIMSACVAQPRPWAWTSKAAPVYLGQFRPAPGICLRRQTGLDGRQFRQHDRKPFVTHERPV